jgi:hypothetical protein
VGTVTVEGSGGIDDHPPQCPTSSKVIVLYIHTCAYTDMCTLLSSRAVIVVGVVSGLLRLFTRTRRTVGQ